MASSAFIRKRLTVGKLAELADVSANAVRFYEREGLMQVPPKTRSGYRLHGPEAVQRLRFIKQAQHCGFTLTEIQALLQLRDQPSARAVQAGRDLCGAGRTARVPHRLLDRRGPGGDRAGLPLCGAAVVLKGLP